MDQGGCFETSRPTTQSDPTFEVDGILTNATLPYVLHLAGAGVARAARENPGPARGVNATGGKVTDEPVAEATGQPHTELFETLGERAAA